MMQNNPNVKELNNLIQQSGGNPEVAFRKKAEEMGINPEEIIGMFK